MVSSTPWIPRTSRTTILDSSKRFLASAIAIASHCPNTRFTSRTPGTARIWDRASDSNPGTNLMRMRIKAHCSKKCPFLNLNNLRKPTRTMLASLKSLMVISKQSGRQQRNLKTNWIFSTRLTSVARLRSSQCPMVYPPLANSKYYYEGELRLEFHT